MRAATILALAGSTTVLAVKCSLSNKCPQETPCCSQYGECGTGAYCLGGCDPRMSFSLDACVPAPVCKSKTTKFNSLDSIADISKYLGDSSEADWVAQGETAQHDGNVLLTMPKKSVGTVLASTSYMWYGNVKARMRTSRGRGVVTAFILLSDVKDEIDYEFVGVDLQTAQTNYYFQGIPDYHNSGNISVSDSYSNFHDYEIRWTPDKIEWLVDGQVGRTKLRKDTWNETTQQWQFPQTPARVQLSIWPGGLASNAPGTIKWAGGVIDWDNAEDMKNPGYFYATVSEVSIECYDGKQGPGSHRGKSYTYNNARGTNDTVVDGNKDTVIGSLEATGLDKDKGKDNDDGDGDSSSSSTDSADKPKKTGNMIPGGGNGFQGQDHSGEAKGGNVGASSGTGSADCDKSSFSQDCNAKSSNNNGGKSSGNKVRASALAMIIAGSAVLWL
ncbi:Putative glycosidase crf2 [Hirsutella minnesotensis 3608]|uniref:Crh-like protein n=1 Tax=Hirsutella minnesotensis 3608 TaxID=1043627 RepID=A0A0F7ZSW6_9HYPO|nr:Putative glycosidase crf2 [Hirsutella minnesotensis 3608]